MLTMETVDLERHFGSYDGWFFFYLHKSEES
jgi:hypothetical protein